MDQTFYTAPEESTEPVIIPEEPTPSPDNAEVRRHFSRLGMSYAVMTVAYMAVAYAAQFLLMFLFPSILSAWWLNWVMSLIPLYGVGLPVLLLMLRRVPAAPHNTDCFIAGATREKPRFHMGHWLILLVIAFGCMTAGNIIGSIVMQIMSVVMDYDYAFALESMVSSSPLWMTFFATCICAPLGEELLFRKLLIDRTRRFGDLTAILLSGVLFGLFHGNLFQLFYATLVGMLLAYVYTRSGSYWWCVGIHAAVNFMGGILIPQLAELLPEDLLSITNSLQPLIYLFIIVWQYGMLIAGIVLFSVLLSRRKLSRGSARLSGGKTLGLLLSNPGMILTILLMLAILAVNLIPIRG